MRDTLIHAAVGGDSRAARLTNRLRTALATEIASGNRAVEEVARTHGVSWPTAHRALVAAAARWLPEPEPTKVLGIDETRARSVRWVLAEAGWYRSDPWLTSFVDADTTSPGRMLGLAPGRSGACVKDWINEQSSAFRDAIEVVVIDTSAPYASGVRAAVPDAKIAVDKWHLVALANTMVTEVRQRVTRERYGRRSTHQGAGVGQPAPAPDRLSTSRSGSVPGSRPPSRARTPRTRSAPPGESRNGFDCCSARPMNTGSGTGCTVLSGRRASRTPETTRLATTIETWWPAIHVALTMKVTNARTEGFNRIIKNTKRVACGFRNLELPAPDTLNHRAHPSTTRRNMTTAPPAESRRTPYGA